jgi:uncharacterized membrane protein YkvA (DUF1232 family)
MKKSFPAKAFSTWILNWYRNTIRHPKYRWWLIIGTLVYLLDPLDLLPDTLPLVGWVDDGLITTVLVAEVAQVMGDRLKNQRNNHSTGISKSDSTVVDMDSISLS